MSYRLLAPLYDWVAPRISRYRSPALLASTVLRIAPEGCHLLDIGVGTGLSVAPYVGSPRFARIVGIEPSRHMLQRCRRKFSTLELHQGTLEEVKAHLGSRFDIVQSCGAVEHVEDVMSLVRDVAGLLRPGGYFVFTYEPEVLYSTRQSRHALHIGTFGREHVFRRTPTEIDRALGAAGLRISEDVEFKAYLGLVHHLVVARPACAAY